MRQLLPKLLYENTKLPKDIINLINDFTTCDCIEISRFVNYNRIHLQECIDCGFQHSQFIRHRYNCPRCYKKQNPKSTRCKICHQCLIKENPTMRCLDCDDFFISRG